MNIKTDWYLLIPILLLVVWIDDRRGKKAEKLNNIGLCARCGKPLGCSSDLIAISGGGRSLPRTGLACHKCAAIVGLQTKILYSLIALAFAGTFFFWWWNGRA